GIRGFHVTGVQTCALPILGGGSKKPGKQQKYMETSMKYIVWIARIIVGSLFIISGLIKLNDPMGFSFKLEEYFSPGVLDLPFLRSEERLVGREWQNRLMLG